MFLESEMASITFLLDSLLENAKQLNEVFVSFQKRSDFYYIYERLHNEKPENLNEAEGKPILINEFLSSDIQAGKEATTRLVYMSVQVAENQSLSKSPTTDDFDNWRLASTRSIGK